MPKPQKSPRTRRKPLDRPSDEKNAVGALSALARRLGVSRQLISLHAKKPDAPPLDDFEGWQTFLVAFGRQAQLPPDLKVELAKAKVRIAKAMAADKERANKIKDHEVVEFAVVERFISETMSFLFGEHDRLGATMPAMLKGCSELEISDKLKADLERINQGLEGRMKVLCNGHGEGKV